MDIDKLIPRPPVPRPPKSFGSLMDIDKLIHLLVRADDYAGFGSLMDIDKLIPVTASTQVLPVLVL